MNPSTIALCIGLITAMLLSAGEVARANTLRMGGIGAATMLLPHLFEAFEGSGAVKLKVIPNLGSSGGLRALTDDVLDVAVSGPPVDRAGASGRAEAGSQHPDAVRPGHVASPTKWPA